MDTNSKIKLLLKKANQTSYEIIRIAKSITFQGSLKYVYGAKTKPLAIILNTASNV